MQKPRNIAADRMPKEAIQEFLKKKKKKFIGFKSRTSNAKLQSSIKGKKNRIKRRQNSDLPRMIHSPQRRELQSREPGKIEAFKDFKGFQTMELARDLGGSLNELVLDKGGLNSHQSEFNKIQEEFREPLDLREENSRKEDQMDPINGEHGNGGESGMESLKPRSSKSVNKAVGEYKRLGRKRNLMGAMNGQKILPRGKKRDECLSDRKGKGKRKLKFKAKRMLGKSLKSDYMKDYLVSVSRMRNKHLGAKVSRSGKTVGLYPKKRKVKGQRRGKLAKVNKSIDASQKSTRNSGSYVQKARDTENYARKTITSNLKSKKQKDSRKNHSEKVKIRNTKAKVVNKKKTKLNRKTDDQISIYKMKKFLKKPAKTRSKSELELAGLSQIEKTLRYYYRFKTFWKQTAVKNFLEQHLGVKLGYVRDIEPMQQKPNENELPPIKSMKNGPLKKKKKRSSLMSEKGKKKDPKNRSSSMQNSRATLGKSKGKQTNIRSLKKEFLESLESEDQSEKGNLVVGKRPLQPRVAGKNWMQLFKREILNYLYTTISRGSKYIYREKLSLKHINITYKKMKMSEIQIRRIHTLKKRFSKTFEENIKEMTVPSDNIPEGFKNNKISLDGALRIGSFGISDHGAKELRQDIKRFKKDQNLSHPPKMFIASKAYKDFRHELVRRGWVENPDFFSPIFDLKYCVRLKHIDYHNLLPEQVISHFLGAKALTNKYELSKNIKNLVSFDSVDIDQFFPRCYDMNCFFDHSNFILDFQIGQAVVILKRFALQFVGFAGKHVKQNKKSERDPQWLAQSKQKALLFQILVSIVVVLRYISIQENICFERQIISTRETHVLRETKISQKTIHFSKTHFWAYLDEARSRCQEVSSFLAISGEGIQPEELVGTHNCFPVHPRSNICKVAQNYKNEGIMKTINTYKTQRAKKRIARKGMKSMTENELEAVCELSENIVPQFGSQIKIKTPKDLVDSANEYGLKDFDESPVDFDSDLRNRDFSKKVDNQEFNGAEIGQSKTLSSTVNINTKDSIEKASEKPVIAYEQNPDQQFENAEEKAKVPETENTNPSKMEKTIFDMCLLSLQGLKEGNPQYYLQDTSNLWILKPGGLSRGRGIRVFGKLEEIEGYWAAAECEMVIMKYIERPLLINKKKFDIRVWVVVTSLDPLRVWMYEDYYIRLSLMEYNVEDSDDVFVHLTNNSVAKKNKKLKDRIYAHSMLSRKEFRDYCQEVGGEAYNSRRFHTQMHRLIIHTLKSGRVGMLPRRKSFSTYGFDLMVDTNFDIWLLEVNSSPSMDTNTTITEIIVPDFQKSLAELVSKMYFENFQLGSIGNRLGGLKRIKLRD